MTGAGREEGQAMVYHVGNRFETVCFIGGPFDGQRRQFVPSMMSDVYVHQVETPGIYRLHRTANPDRTGRGWVDLNYLYDDRDAADRTQRG